MDSLPAWKGLWDWSMRYQDGTQPSAWNPEEISPEKMKWLGQVLEHYMQDFVKRMKEIKVRLEEQSDDGQSIEEKERLLDELIDIVSSIDYARDLHKIGGVPTLLELLESPTPSLRWRAAEVLATCAQNNPPVQQWFLEGGVLPHVFALLRDEEPVVIAKALLATSAMVRHCPPALTLMQHTGGLVRVIGLLAHQDPRVKRKALALLTYILSVQPSEAELVLAEGGLPHILASSIAIDDSDQRAAALDLLTQLAAWPSARGTLNASPELQTSVAALEAAHSLLSDEDRDVQQEEVQSLRQLHSALAGTSHPSEENIPNPSGALSASQNGTAGLTSGSNAGQGNVAAAQSMQLGPPLIPYDPR